MLPSVENHLYCEHLCVVHIIVFHWMFVIRVHVEEMMSLLNCINNATHGPTLRIIYESPRNRESSRNRHINEDTYQYMLHQHSGLSC